MREAEENCRGQRSVGVARPIYSHITLRRWRRRSTALSRCSAAGAAPGRWADALKPVTRSETSYRELATTEAAGTAAVPKEHSNAFRKCRTP